MTKITSPDLPHPWLTWRLGAKNAMVCGDDLRLVAAEACRLSITTLPWLTCPQYHPWSCCLPALFHSLRIHLST